MEGWADKQELRNLNNFSSMAGVVAGLNSAPITRLKRTKELLSAKTVSLKANLDATLDSTKNFANYKEMLKTINPPCVPFFGASPFFAHCYPPYHLSTHTSIFSFV
jgi:hypothetical protein